MNIGVLAIQGSVLEHRKVLEKLGAEVVEVRVPQDLEGISGIILPGGESTTQSKLLQEFGFFSILQQKISAGLPAWGTCAGAILLAKKVVGKNAPKTLAVMDITANRNWYGGQLDSFIAPIEIDFPHQKKVNLEGVFIRAPRMEIMPNSSVQVLAQYRDAPILLQQGQMLASAFHPELTANTAVHEYFLSFCIA